MKRIFVLLIVLLLGVSGCGSASEEKDSYECYLCDNLYTGKTYDYPTIGGPPEQICRNCYEDIFCYECEDCGKFFENRNHKYKTWTEKSDSGTRYMKLCEECFSKRTDS